jgi:tRNA (guanosine-2'-O-)-methyltransferase
MLTEERIEKLLNCVGKRQYDMTIILENVFDPHNIGAVMRSCEAVGISEIYVIQTIQHETADLKNEISVGKHASSGVKKWVKTHFYNDRKHCIAHVRNKYKRILTTAIHENSVSLYELDLTSSFALVFGNEADGISQEMLALSDGNFIIPMYGLVESLNISVACSVSIFEAMRQRINNGMYESNYDENNPEMYQLLNEYLSKTKPRVFEKDKDVLMKEVRKYKSKLVN